MSEYQAFVVELIGSVAHVQINRPEKINAMNAAFWTEIIDIFRWVDDTDAVRAVVLSGAGKHFSSGIDLMMLASVANDFGKDVGRNARLLRRKILELQASFNAVDTCRKPVLAAIQGYCIGGAIDLISACDMRYAAEDAQFSIKEIDIGMAADVGTLQRLPRIIGDGMLRELAYTGRQFRRRGSAQYRPGQSRVSRSGKPVGRRTGHRPGNRRQIADCRDRHQGHDQLHA
jgi:enoyl-CoA hydratase